MKNYFSSIPVLFVILVSFQFILNSCVRDLKYENHQTVEIETFPGKKNIAGVDLDIYPVVKRIGIADSLLVITVRTDEFQFCLFNPSTNSVTGYIGQLGHGPDEFSREGSYYGQYAYNKNGLGIWLFDRNLRLLRLYNINKSNAGYGRAENKVIVKGMLLAEGSIFYINDRCIIGTSMSNQGQFFIFNPNSDSLRFINLYPQKNSKNPSMSNLFAGFGRISPNGNKVAIAYLYFNRIDILDVETKNILSIFVNLPNGNNITDELNIEDLGKGYLGYSGLFLANNHIYALKNHCTLATLSQGNYNSEIHVFDYNGRPLYILYLDRSIDTFVVDKDERTIFGGHYYTDGTLSKFSISN